MSDTATLYAANVELFTLKLDHSLSVSEFQVFKSASSLIDDGLQTVQGKRVEMCTGAWRWQWTPCCGYCADVLMC